MNFTKTVIWCCLMLALITWQSCVSDNGDKEVITEVMDEFNINMIETLGDTRQLTFEFESVEMEPCLNSSIDRTVVVGDRKVSILLDGVLPASDCNPGAAPATATGNAGKLPSLIYDFDVTIRGTVVNEGKLKVNSEQYEINLSTLDGIVITDNVLYKIPANCIWGYVAYNDANTVGNAPSDFLSDLTYLSQAKNLHKGYYGYFKAMDNNEIILKETPSFNHVTTFYHKFTGSKSALMDVLDSYRSGSNSSDMEMVIYTSEGEAL